jgi:hypothetical protein
MEAAYACITERAAWDWGAVGRLCEQRCVNNPFHAFQIEVDVKLRV